MTKTALGLALALAALLPASPAGSEDAVPRCHGKKATIWPGHWPMGPGRDGFNEIYGTPGDDVIVGTGGGDAVWGKQGNDTICTGAGNDWVAAGAGRDWVNGGPGDDGALSGGSGRDVIHGGDGNDYCVDLTHRDRLDCETERR
jgi:Ca2+-binding RTX toxin-like protein